MQRGSSSSAWQQKLNLHGTDWHKDQPVKKHFSSSGNADWLALVLVTKPAGHSPSSSTRVKGAERGLEQITLPKIPS